MSPRNERSDQDDDDDGVHHAGNNAEEMFDEEEEGQDEEFDQQDNNGEEYDEDAETERRSKKRKKSAKEEKRKYKSDEGRRALRVKQRELKEDIQACSTTEELHKHREANNKIFKNVHYTREAVCDAENNLLLATKMVQNAERLVQVRTKNSGISYISFFLCSHANMLCFHAFLRLRAIRSRPSTR
jgi:hypothetical protein